MINPKTFLEYWRKFSFDELIDNGISLRRISDHGIHIGLHSETKNKVIAVQLKKELKVIELENLPKWSGIRFSPFHFSIDSPGILIELKKEEFESVFISFAADITYEIENTEGKEQSFAIVESVADQWDQFFKKYGTEELSYSKQVGLFGELIILRNELLSRNNITNPLNLWKGYDRKEHDYVFPNGDLEVKTTTAKQHQKIHIQSEKQLDDRGLKYLYVCALELRESGSDGISLSQLVNEIFEILSSNSSAQTHFNRKLKVAGYLSADEHKYLKYRFYLKSEKYFHVREGFPRITDPINGIGDIKYSVMLSAIEDFKVSSDECYSNLL